MCSARILEHIQAEEVLKQNTEENLLFVGVMAGKYLDTLGKASYDTWGSNLPGKIAFFSSEDSRSFAIPLVPLIGVDDSYPPQKKSFAMLKYIHDNYLDQFEWFMRADDDVYVRTNKLEALLRSVDSRKPWFIGQTERGNSEEFGLLSLESDENFCMGGPGIILSRETLRRIGPHIEECLKNLYTTHEDVELGRCVKKMAWVSCTWYTEENLLFVGVMAGKYLDTSGKASHDTWGSNLPDKIAFFSSEDSRSFAIPLVPLIGVDDSYPPQKKSFAMLKYMHDNYLDQFEWFMLADDDVYVRTNKLEALLQSIDSRKPWFIGQTERGNSEEFGLFSLESDENFCTGGPGIILSRETLRRIGPHIEECLENLYTTHEDVELGRCVKKMAGVSCTWSYEASDFTSQAREVL